MEITNDRVLTFRKNALDYILEQKNKNDGPEEKKKTQKLTHALERMISRTNAVEKKYNDAIQDLRIDHASEDDKKNLIVDASGQFSFTKENHKKLVQAIRNKLEEKVSIEPYVATSVPDDLNFAIKEIFEDFVIKKVENKEQDEPETIN